MRRLIRVFCLAAIAATVCGCAGMYVAGDAGPHHENLSGRPVT